MLLSGKLRQGHVEGPSLEDYSSNHHPLSWTTFVCTGFFFFFLIVQKDRHVIGGFPIYPGGIGPFPDRPDKAFSYPLPYRGDKGDFRFCNARRQ